MYTEREEALEYPEQGCKLYCVYSRHHRRAYTWAQSPLDAIAFVMATWGYRARTVAEQKEHQLRQALGDMSLEQLIAFRNTLKGLQ